MVALSSLGGDGRRRSTFLQRKKTRATTVDDEKETARKKRRRRGGGVKAAGSDGDDVNDENECSFDERKDHMRTARKVRARGEGQGTVAKEVGGKGSKRDEEDDERKFNHRRTGARMKPRGTGQNLESMEAMKREQIFDFGRTRKDGNWLQDGLEFVSKEQPSEQLTVAAMSEEDQNTVNRRLAIGIASDVWVHLPIPDDFYRRKPEKPLFFYLVPVG